MDIKRYPNIFFSNASENLNLNIGILASYTLCVRKQKRIPHEVTSFYKVEASITLWTWPSHVGARCVRADLSSTCRSSTM